MVSGWQQTYRNLTINIVYEVKNLTFLTKSKKSLFFNLSTKILSMLIKYCRHLVRASHRLAVLAIITDLLTNDKYNFREGCDMVMAMVKASYLCYQEWSCEARQQLLTLYEE